MYEIRNNDGEVIYLLTMGRLIRRTRFEQIWQRRKVVRCHHLSESQVALECPDS